MTRPRVEPSPLARLRPSATTIGIAIAALVGVALVHRDPWSGGATKVPLVSNQSVARRLFPNLGEHDLSQARIELARAGGAHVRLVPGPDGRHQLYADEQLLGSADPVAVEGLWSSLRMATTLRAVDRRVKPGERRGAIVVVLGEETLTLEIMGPTAEGAGYYGALTHEHGDIWVVESEVVALVQQPPETWLSRRLLLVEPAATTRVAFEGDGAPEKSVVLARGEDGLWRGHREPDGRARLLATAAVETRLDRLFATPVTELVTRDRVPEGALTPWLEVRDVEGRTHVIKAGGPCPDGDPGLRVIDRGPGLLACVPAERMAPIEPDGSLLEGRLVPWGYGRILAVDMRRPASRRLRRRGGGWVLEDGAAEDPPRAERVSEPEVYRWYSAVRAVELGPAGVEFTPEVDLVFESDSTQNLRVRCGPPILAPTDDAAAPEARADEAPAVVCQRDDGPPLAVRSAELPQLVFTAETFADRRLVQLGAGEPRAAELLPGPGGDGIRQSIRQDMGVWRLDAPVHPEGDGALDGVRIDELLAAVSELRASAWVEAPQPRALMRTIRVETTPTSQGPGAVEVALYRGCVVQVVGQPRSASVEEETCAILRGDLFYDDPLRDWLSRARSVEVSFPGGEVIQARRTSPDAWQVDRGSAERWAQLYEEMTAFRTTALISGEPSSEASERIEIRIDGGAAIGAKVSETWVQLDGADWYYRGELRDGLDE